MTGPPAASTMRSARSMSLATVRGSFMGCRDCRARDGLDGAENRRVGDAHHGGDSPSHSSSGPERLGQSAATSTE